MQNCACPPLAMCHGVVATVSGSGGRSSLARRLIGRPGRASGGRKRVKFHLLRSMRPPVSERMRRNEHSLADAKRRRIHVAIINPKAFVRSTSNPDVPPPPRRVVVLLHGFNSRGEWFEDLQQLVSTLTDDRVVALPIPFRRVFTLEFPFFARSGRYSSHTACPP